MKTRASGKALPTPPRVSSNRCTRKWCKRWFYWLRYQKDICEERQVMGRTLNPICWLYGCTWR